MERLIISSLRQSAGKTSLIIGLAKALGMKLGYMKPFGERFLYKKKRLWDYDAALISRIFDLEDGPEELSIGFHHLQMFYSLDKKATKEKLLETFQRVSEDKEIVFVEAGKDFSFGTSVHLDAQTLATDLDGQMIFVISGDENTVADDIGFLANRLPLDREHFKGVVINKVMNVSDFTDSYLPIIEKMGLPLLGVIPYCPELTYLTVEFLANRILAKVLTGESALHRQIRDIVVGSIGTEAAIQNGLFDDRHKALIVSGDRSDMILSAIESGIATVVLTNNIVPSSATISRAEAMGVPLLLVPTDTHATARQVDSIEALPTVNDTGKIAVIEKMVRNYIDLQRITGTKP
ncbi:MAG: AAA family ATPase [Deltaproteobacteria bacterium]|jgi:BioD-like phosphotransacetylase family protein|nr:AAA family ATPase [Syntrophaceae bacterium]